MQWWARSSWGKENTRSPRISFVENRWFWIYKYEKIWYVSYAVVCVSLSRVISPESTLLLYGCKYSPKESAWVWWICMTKGSPQHPVPHVWTLLVTQCWSTDIYQCATDSWYSAWLPGVICSGSCHSCQELKDSTKMCWASMKLLKRL